MVWGLRWLAHAAILRGLRAPRLMHSHRPLELLGCSRPAREVQVTGTGGKRLFGWLVLPPQPTAEAVPAVLVMHGWGSNAAVMASVVPPLHAAGFAVLLLDARCHGRSDDEAFTSMPRFAEDIAAGLAWLAAQLEVDSQRLALLGHSVGAAAALLYAAQHREVRAVVSLSAFAHPGEVMRRWLIEMRLPYPVIGWALLRHVQRVIGSTFDAIAPLTTLGAVRCPVLLVHGLHDETVPVDDARRLLVVGAQAQLLLVDGGHDLRTALLPHASVLTEFLCAACGVRPSPPIDRKNHRGLHRKVSEPG